MRLFFALTFDTATKSDLKRNQNVLRKHTIKGRFTHEENFHVTLAFIGESTQEQKRILIKTLHQLDGRCPSLFINCFGSFRQNGSKLVWLGVKESLELTRLQSDLIHKLGEQGISTESRKYLPHITLARHVESPSLLQDIPIKPRWLPIYSIALMESKFVENKLMYQVLDEVLC
ncbi:RNA 2',3'-cyclic phosphodiesterase [Vibrio alfacsensis]|uniref:RNA 2',3'-cyclic phosphodiesterase n=1 Tax=Vibrio alfacsensis TaxID=1074311 RepID=UPI004068993E